MAVLTIQNTFEAFASLRGNRLRAVVILMVWRRTSYITKVVLTTKVLFAPKFAFPSFIPPWRGLNRVPWQRQSRMLSAPFRSCFPKLQNRNFCSGGADMATRAVIPVGATRAVILEAIPVAAVGEVIPTPEAEVEDPMEDNEIPNRTLKTTPKCSR